MPEDTLLQQLQYVPNKYTKEMDDKNFVIPFIAMNNGKTPAQIRAQSRGLYKDIQRNPFIRKTGVFTEKNTIPDIDITSLVYYGTLEQSKIAPTLENIDVKLYYREPSLKKVPDNLGSSTPGTHADTYIWRELPVGFHVYNNDTVYGYEWIVLQSDYVNTDGIYNLHMNIEDGLGVCKFAGTQGPINLAGVQYKIVITAKNLWTREFSLLDSMPLIQNLTSRTKDLAPSVEAVRAFYEKALETLKVVTETLFVGTNKDLDGNITYGVTADKDGGYAKHFGIGDIKNVNKFLHDTLDELHDHKKTYVDDVVIDAQGEVIGVHGIINKGAEGNINAKSLAGAKLSNGAQAVITNLPETAYIPYVNENIIGLGTKIKHYHQATGVDPEYLFEESIIKDTVSKTLQNFKTVQSDELTEYLEQISVGTTKLNLRFKTTPDPQKTVLHITAGLNEEKDASIKVSEVQTNKINFGVNYLDKDILSGLMGASSVAYKKMFSELLGLHIKTFDDGKFETLKPNTPTDVDGNKVDVVHTTELSSNELLVPSKTTIGAFDKLGSALQALMELPLGTFEYKRGKELYKEQLGIFVERVNQIRDNLSVLKGPVGEDEQGNPSSTNVLVRKRNSKHKSDHSNIVDNTVGSGTLTDERAKNNAYTYTDEEVKSIVHYLDLMTSKQELAQEIRNTVGILLKAAKETQVRLLDVETAIYGWDAETIPGTDESRKTFIEKHIDQKLKDQINSSALLLGLNRLMRVICLELFDTTDLERIDAELESKITDSDKLGSKVSIKSRMDQIDEITNVLYSQQSAMVRFYTENVLNDESLHSYTEVVDLHGNTRITPQAGLAEDESLLNNVKDDFSDSNRDRDKGRTWRNLPSAEYVKDEVKDRVGFADVFSYAHEHTPSTTDVGLVRIPSVRKPKITVKTEYVVDYQAGIDMEIYFPEYMCQSVNEYEKYKKQFEDYLKDTTKPRPHIELKGVSYGIFDVYERKEKFEYIAKCLQIEPPTTPEVHKDIKLLSRSEYTFYKKIYDDYQQDLSNQEPESQGGPNFENKKYRILGFEVKNITPPAPPIEDKSVSEGSVEHEDETDFDGKEGTTKTQRDFNLFELDKKKAEFTDEYAAVGTYKPYFKTKAVAWDTAKLERVNLKLSEVTKTIYGTDDVTAKFPNRTEVLRRNITNLIDDLYPNRSFAVEQPKVIPNDPSANIVIPFKSSKQQTPSHNTVAESMTDEGKPVNHISIIRWLDNEIFNFDEINHYIGKNLKVSQGDDDFAGNKQIVLNKAQNIIHFKTEKLVTDLTPFDTNQYGTYAKAYSKLDLLSSIIGINNCYFIDLYSDEDSILDIHEDLSTNLDVPAQGLDPNGKKKAELTDQLTKNKLTEKQLQLSIKRLVENVKGLQARIETLKTEIENIERQIAEERLKLTPGSEEQEQKLKDLQRRIQELQTELASLNEQVILKTQTILSIENHIPYLEEQILDITTTITKQENDLRILTEQLTTLSLHFDEIKGLENIRKEWTSLSDTTPDKKIKRYMKDILTAFKTEDKEAIITNTMTGKDEDLVLKGKVHNGTKVDNVTYTDDEFELVVENKFTKLYPEPDKGDYIASQCKRGGVVSNEGTLCRCNVSTEVYQKDVYYKPRWRFDKATMKVVEEFPIHTLYEDEACTKVYQSNYKRPSINVKFLYKGIKNNSFYTLNPDLDAVSTTENPIFYDLLKRGFKPNKDVVDSTTGLPYYEFDTVFKKVIKDNVKKISDDVYKDGHNYFKLKTYETFEVLTDKVQVVEVIQPGCRLYKNTDNILHFAESLTTPASYGFMRIAGSDLWNIFEDQTSYYQRDDSEVLQALKDQYKNVIDFTKVYTVIRGVDSELEYQDPIVENFKLLDKGVIKDVTTKTIEVVIDNDKLEIEVATIRKLESPTIYVKSDFNFVTQQNLEKVSKPTPQDTYYVYNIQSQKIFRWDSNDSVVKVEETEYKHVTIEDVSEVPDGLKVPRSPGETGLFVVIKKPIFYYELQNVYKQCRFELTQTHMLKWKTENSSQTKATADLQNPNPLKWIRLHEATWSGTLKLKDETFEDTDELYFSKVPQTSKLSFGGEFVDQDILIDKLKESNTTLDTAYESAKNFFEGTYNQIWTEDLEKDALNAEFLERKVKLEKQLNESKTKKTGLEDELNFLKSPVGLMNPTRKITFKGSLVPVEVQSLENEKKNLDDLKKRIKDDEDELQTVKDDYKKLVNEIAAGSTNNAVVNFKIQQLLKKQAELEEIIKNLNQQVQQVQGDGDVNLIQLDPFSVNLFTSTKNCYILDYIKLLQKTQETIEDLIRQIVELDAQGTNVINVLPQYIKELDFVNFVAKKNITSSPHFEDILSEDISNVSTVGFVVSRKLKSIQDRLTTTEAFLDILGKSFEYLNNVYKRPKTDVINEEPLPEHPKRFESVNVWKSLKRTFDQLNTYHTDPRIYDLDLADSYENKPGLPDLSIHNRKVWQFVEYSRNPKKSTYTVEQVDNRFSGSYKIENVQLMVKPERLPFQDPAYNQGWDLFTTKTIQVVYVNDNVELSDPDITTIYLKSKQPPKGLLKYYKTSNAGDPNDNNLINSHGWQNQTEYNTYKTLQKLTSSLLNNGEQTIDTTTLDKDNNLFYQLMLLVYPVGSLFITADVRNPEVCFGGKWRKIEDKFLLGVGGREVAAGVNGGNKTITLNLSQLPLHTHSLGSLSTPGGFDVVSTDQTTVSANGVFKIESVNHVGTNSKRDDIHGVSDNFNKYRISFNPSGTLGHTDPQGNNQPIDITPTYYSVHIWQRIEA